MAGESNLIVPNLLEQNFKTDAPNQKWVTDITYLPFGESMLYLWAILDLYNNEVIAYKVSDTQNAQLVYFAIEKCRVLQRFLQSVAAKEFQLVRDSALVKR